MRERHAERDGILRHHDIGRRADIVDRRHLVVAFDPDPGDVVGGIAVFGAQLQNGLHRRVRCDVAGKPLEHDRARGVVRAEIASELGGVELAATEHAQKPERAFQHAYRPGESVRGEACRQYPALRRAPEMEPLDHGPGARAGKFHQPAGERSRDPQRVAHALRIKSHQLSARDRGAERTGRARCVKAAPLVAMPGGAADADHHFGAGDERSDKVASTAAALLGDGKPCREQRRAGMHACARPGEIVHLERVGERAVGQCRGGRMHAPAARGKDTTVAAGAGFFGIGGDDPAPGQIRAEGDRGDGVGNALFGATDDIRRNILIATARRVLRQPYRLVCHADLALRRGKWIIPAAQARMNLPARRHRGEEASEQMRVPARSRA